MKPSPIVVDAMRRSGQTIPANYACAATDNSALIGQLTDETGTTLIGLVGANKSALNKLDADDLKKVIGLKSDLKTLIAKLRSYL